MLCIGGLLVAAACSRRVLGAILDLPADTEASTRRPDSTAVALSVTPLIPVVDTNRPPIEKTLDPDSVVRMLPKDNAGNIDWMAALRSGTIRPRAVLPGRVAPLPSFQFAFDFYFKGPDTTFDALFPHSSHTAWLNCQQCHARIFPYRGTTIQMGDVFQGKFCGECHAKVSFPVMTGCERCHTRMKMPPNRAQPELIGTLTLKRAPGDSSRGGTIEGNASGVKTEDFPRARFPHWVHRIRYQCKACHMELFVPVAGANSITMKQISAGNACGTCHDGRTAFAASFGFCERCHTPPPKTATAGPVIETRSAR